MAMTLTSRKELYKLRELVHFLLAGAGSSSRSGGGTILCCFCKATVHDLEFITHGNSIGPKFNEALSIHHVNGDHDDNRMANKALCHTSCHKSHHRAEANRARSRKAS